MQLVFDEKTHKYALYDGDFNKIDLVSVTQLLKRHGLAPDYSGIDNSILERKAERGRIVHAELEDYIKHGKVGFTRELECFIKACKKYKITPTASEFMVHNNEIAGTVDFIGVWGESELPCIGDFKTTTVLHKESVAWQLSLYAYLIKDEIFEKFICVHFPDSETCNIVEVEPIPIAEIEELLRCERGCELYKKKTLKLTSQEEFKLLDIKTSLEAISKRKAQLEQQEQELKEFLLEKMRESGIYQIDNELFKITYVAPFERTIIDSRRLKNENPELFEKYTRTTQTEASVRITLKKQGEVI